MPRGGKRPGTGRKPGTLNKTTIEREELARQAILESAGRDPMQLAKYKLEQYMGLAESAMDVLRPTTVAEIKAGVPKNPDGDWVLFGQWFDRMGRMATELVKYQSPALRAVTIGPPAVQEATGETVLRGLLDEIDEEARARRAKPVQSLPAPEPVPMPPQKKQVA